MDGICKILDGGLASQLVANGYSSIDSDPLWSARLLHTNPAAIQNAHQQFLKAGADILETNTYQVSIEGFKDYLSLSGEKTLQCIQESVTKLVKPLVEECERNTGRSVSIAGSIGPYGACQHDGSEYTGNYLDSMTVQQLMDWHRPRLQALSEAGVDMFAFETIPGAKEGEALVQLLQQEFPQQKAWLSFTCKDGSHTSHGELLVDAVKSGIDCDQITHVGVNCVAPDLVESLLLSLQVYKDKKPFIVYPNSGGFWKSGKGWDADTKLSNIESFVSSCVRNGAKVIGGCCKVTHTEIEAMRIALDKLKLRGDC